MIRRFVDKYWLTAVLVCMAHTLGLTIGVSISNDRLEASNAVLKDVLDDNDSLHRQLDQQMRIINRCLKTRL